MHPSLRIPAARGRHFTRVAVSATEVGSQRLYLLYSCAPWLTDELTANLRCESIGIR